MNRRKTWRSRKKRMSLRRGRRGVKKKQEEGKKVNRKTTGRRRKKRSLLRGRRRLRMKSRRGGSR